MRSPRAALLITQWGGLSAQRQEGGEGGRNEAVVKIVAKSLLLRFRLIDQTTEQLLFFTELVPPNRDATERRGNCGGFRGPRRQPESWRGRTECFKAPQLQNSH